MEKTKKTGIALDRATKRKLKKTSQGLNNKVRHKSKNSKRIKKKRYRGQG